MDDLTWEMATAIYPTENRPWTDADIGPAWLALRREMLKSRWAKARNLPVEDVDIAFNPRARKAFFQWKPAVKFLTGSTRSKIADLAP